MLMVFGVIAFVAILIVGRRLLLRAPKLAMRFADAMQRAGLEAVPGEEGVFRVERDGHFVTVRVMHRGVMATVSASTSADLAQHRFSQRYALEQARLQPEGEPRDAATAAVDELVLRSARPFRDAVGLAVGPGIVNGLVFALSEPALAREVLQVMPAAEQLLGKVTEAYRTHDHLPVLTRAQASAAFAAALDVPGLHPSTDTDDTAMIVSETGTVSDRWRVEQEGDRCYVDFAPEFDQASISWLRGTTELADRDDDDAQGFVRGNDGRLTPTAEALDTAAASVHDAVTAHEISLVGVRRLDVYDGGIDVSVSGSDPTDVAHLVNELLPRTRALHAQLASVPR